MRSLLFFSITFFVFCYPAFGELTAADIEQFRMIIREDVRVIVEEEVAASEKRMKEYVDVKFEGMKEYVDVKFEGFEGKFTLVVSFILALIVLIVVTVGIPQILLAWRSRNEQPTSWTTTY